MAVRDSNGRSFMLWLISTLPRNCKHGCHATIVHNGGRHVQSGPKWQRVRTQIKPRYLDWVRVEEAISNHEGVVIVQPALFRLFRDGATGTAISTSDTQSALAASQRKQPSYGPRWLFFPNGMVDSYFANLHNTRASRRWMLGM